MTSHYIALIHKEDDSDFGVSFPDFPGVITAGRTLEDAMSMAIEALAFALEDVDEAPLPSSIDEIMGEPENRDGVAVLVAAPVRRSRAVAIRATFDSQLLAAIDRAAAETGETRSGWLQAAARRRLDGNKSDARDGAPRRSASGR